MDKPEEENSRLRTLKVSLKFAAHLPGNFDVLTNDPAFGSVKAQDVLRQVKNRIWADFGPEALQEAERDLEQD